MRNSVIEKGQVTYAAAALIIPFLVGSLLAGMLAPAGSVLRQYNTQFFLGAGLASWFLGIYWYGLKRVGLRGKRPLLASIGFAVLGWLTFIVTRFFAVEAIGTASGGLTPTFIYLLLFEAFCVQLWTMGTFFRAVTDWRGPLAGTLAAGFLFGLISFFYFEEANFFSATLSTIGLTQALVYFLSWGVFYAVIRLRTGSLLGGALVQAMQSLTTWHLLFSAPDSSPQQLQNLYLFGTLWYLIFIWRLWPKEENDYRV